MATVVTGNPMRPLSRRDSSGSAKGLQASNLQTGLPIALVWIGRRLHPVTREVSDSRVFGAGIGWLIDRALGISPWGLTAFLLLGFAAGVLNVMRSAGAARK
jgi:ATP synthase protein I